jgi:hypothetical protein
MHGLYVRKCVGGLFGLAACFLVAQSAHAALIETLAPDGNGNVVMTGSGSIDLADLTKSGTEGGSTAEIVPGSNIFVTGATPNGQEYFSTSVTGPTSFGTDVNGTAADSASGDIFFLLQLSSSFYFFAVPPGYVSGAPLSNSSTYSGATLASLGVTPGTYTWSWGANADADSIILDISSTPTPEPACLGLLGVPMLLTLRRRR